VVKSAPALRAFSAASIPTFPGSFHETSRVVTAVVYRFQDFSKFSGEGPGNIYRFKIQAVNLKPVRFTNTGNFTRMVIVLGMETSK
jgi:hypothetical protein